MDVAVRLIALAGDYVAEDVWWRIVQIVTNNDSVQAYAAGKVFVEMKNPHVHHNMVKLACHILGEYGDLIVRNGTAS